MILILYEITGLVESLMKALEHYEKHKHVPLPTSKIWQPISEHLWMLKDNPD